MSMVIVLLCIAAAAAWFEQQRNAAVAHATATRWFEQQRHFAVASAEPDGGAPLRARCAIVEVASAHAGAPRSARRAGAHGHLARGPPERRQQEVHR